jgi:uncharacterized glyoxalase superfamily protein PhnB
VSLNEQLDEAVEAIIANPNAPLPHVNARLDALLRIAAELRDLPSTDFKTRLRADLERRATMSSTATKPVRQTITPYLTAQMAAELIEFVKQAFGAEELFRATGTAGGMHAEVRIGDSIVMIGGGEALRGTPNTQALHLYVPDSDAVYRRALQAGAESTGEPKDQPYGDREAGVKDPVGNRWYIATHKATGDKPEGFRSVTPYLHPRGASQMIDFLKQAFGAEEEYRAQSPEGVIHHASIRIGDSALELGEAHGEWQPMSSMFYLYVDDVDAWHQRAVEAGATSINEPADQPYGDRVGGVRDPFGNDWYIGTPINDANYESRAKE